MSVLKHVWEICSYGHFVKLDAYVFSILNAHTFDKSPNILLAEGIRKN